MRCCCFTFRAPHSTVSECCCGIWGSRMVIPKHTELLLPCPRIECSRPTRRRRLQRTSPTLLQKRDSVRYILEPSTTTYSPSHGARMLTRASTWHPDSTSASDGLSCCWRKAKNARVGDGTPGGGKVAEKPLSMEPLAKPPESRWNYPFADIFGKPILVILSIADNAPFVKPSPPVFFE